MKSNRGVTLASLTVYVIVLAIILIILTFVSSNFTSQVSEVTNKGKLSNEVLKLYSYIISDIKSSNKVIEYSDDFVRFDNNSKYYIRYVNGSSNKEKNQYAIYKNDILISENIMDGKFKYDYENNTFSIDIKYFYGNTLVNESKTFKLGRGY